MGETVAPLPDTLHVRVGGTHVELLLDAGNPEIVDKAAARAVLQRNGTFAAERVTPPDSPDGAIYYARVLDAAVIAHRGLFTLSQLRLAFGEAGVPPEIDATKEPGDTTPIVVPARLILDAAGVIRADNPTL